MAVISEALLYGEAVGLDRKTVLDIFDAGAGNSMVLNAKREKLIKGDFSTHFSSALIYKDLHYLHELAKKLKKPLLTGSTIKEIFSLTLSDGSEHLDFSGVYEAIKRL